MLTFLRKQPIKGLYLIYEALTTLFVRVPIWAILAIPKNARPRPSWTITRCLYVKLLKRLSYVASRAGRWWKESNYTALDLGGNAQGVWLSGCPDLIVGNVKEWASLAGVESIRIPGYWFHKTGLDLPIGAAPAPGEKVVYALHGGAYARLSAHPRDPTSHLPRDILKYAGSDVKRALTLEYRLSKSSTDSEGPANPFPAALLDAIAGYNYLVNVVGFAPENILVEGDSAGGNLALALARYLVENLGRTNVSIPRPPGGLVLCSPWVDLGPVEKSSPDSSYYINIPSDYINATTSHIAINTGNFFGPLGREAGMSNRYISPASSSPSIQQISLKGFPRTIIISGGAEVLRDQIHALHKKLVADIGQDNVQFVEYPDALHDFIPQPIHEPERTNALKVISKWIDAE